MSANSLPVTSGQHDVGHLIAAYHASDFTDFGQPLVQDSLDRFRYFHGIKFTVTRSQTVYRIRTGCPDNLAGHLQPLQVPDSALDGGRTDIECDVFHGIHLAAVEPT